MDEIDTWRAAHLIIQRHGNMAEYVAWRRMDKMIEIGDPTGEAAWKRIGQLKLCVATRRGMTRGQAIMELVDRAFCAENICKRK